MDTPSEKKRSINTDTSEHEYDEVQEQPEKQEQFTPNKTAHDHKGSSNPSPYVSNFIPESTDLPPDLPPPKQKYLKTSKNKYKQKIPLKSKIPRTPSLTNSLSSLANSISGKSSHSNNSVPPETPPLPARYQQHLKIKQMSENDEGNGVLSDTTPSAINNDDNCPNSLSMNLISESTSVSGAAIEKHVGCDMPKTENEDIAHQSTMNNNFNADSITTNLVSPKIFQYITLTVRKDENGYGMKVSGDNPVFVESVKPGGAAQIAGLVAGDMILKVNGQEVRLEKHPTVVSLIKASTIVELAVKRSQKNSRPTSVGVIPSTPILSGRDRTASITGPQPVDSIKRREMESYKIQTLQKMLEQEKLNLERLKGETNNPSYKLSEANIRKLREQLRQVGADDSPKTTSANSKNTAFLMFNQSQHLSASATQHNQKHQHHNNHQQQTNSPQTQQTHTSPAFLSLLPRSLSSLSLGTRKSRIDKDTITSPCSNAIAKTQDVCNTMSQSLHQNTTSVSTMMDQQISSKPYLCQQQAQQRLKENHRSVGSSKNKSKFLISKSLVEEDLPPPLPQRNMSRQFGLDVKNDKSITENSSLVMPPVSDLDRASSPHNNTDVLFNVNNKNKDSVKPKRSKNKVKALSDPKMSTQLFLQMETASGTNVASDSSTVLSKFGSNDMPPPLPPRQPSMFEEGNRGSCQNLSNACVHPNSIGSIFNYPLVSTGTAVQLDNVAVAFPFSQRPNIVHQLQMHQQQHHHQFQGVPTSTLGKTPYLSQMKHRRVGSSPDNIHPRHPDRITKTTSGSWELIEKERDVNPPGTPPPPYLTTSQMIVHEDPSESCCRPNNIFIDLQQFTPMEGTMSVVSPLNSNHIKVVQSADTQKEIISMEDENSSDQEEPFIDENGPFNNLTRLLDSENVVFLAVFLNYVFSNSEPAPLLFYLITELYKEGTPKDMRKWAYEIHSTFLVPYAPLSWYRQDESLAREVDNVLQTEFDKIEILRTVFLRSRKRAKDIISEQLREFQQKRTAGLGTIYGPTDDKLSEAKGDKQREQIIEKYLMPNLQLLIEEYEKDLPLEDSVKLALCSALSTVIHRIFNTRSHPNSIVDRVHHFVSREKSFKSRLIGKNRKMIVRGHPLILRQYYEVTHCNHCQTIIWGVSPQGYHCMDCKLNIHRTCSKILDENCPGPLPQAKRQPHNDNKISKFMGKIRPRTSDVIASDKRTRQEDETEIELGNERLHCTSIKRQPSDCMPDANISLRSNGTSAPSSALGTDTQTSLQPIDNAHESNICGSGSDCTVDVTSRSSLAVSATNFPNTLPINIGELSSQDATESKDIQKQRLYRNPHKSAVNRSESYKEHLTSKRNRNSRRKTSDPSLSSNPNDDQTDLGLSNFTYTGSSNSSLSSGGGTESPIISMEQIPRCVATGRTDASQVTMATVPLTQLQNQLDSTHGSIGSNNSNNNTNTWNAGQPLQRPWTFESDEEDDINEVEWSSLITAEMLTILSDAEKKRQEIINEIYQTERNHVRTLNILDRLFFVPLFESNLLSQDLLLLLFPPALLSLRELHGVFEQQLKLRRVQHNHIVNYIGDLLSNMFDGKQKELLCDHAVQFCSRQQIALEVLKEKRHKDEQLQKLLRKSESHKACRRLELKDLLLAEMQRLTKYPMLFENLYKVTTRVLPENTNESEAIQHALESSKNILVEVNKAVKIAEDTHKLQNIQRKLDKSSYEKDEFKKLDLTQHRLIHDGNLTMKKNPSIQLHGLLFENMIVLLTKQDDKYSLKNLHTPLAVNNKPVSPIMNIDAETLVRQEAADKNSFFLIKTKTSQMLELRAPSSSECKTWFKYISDAAAQQYKPRSKNSGTQEVSIDDPSVSVLPHSNTKESLDLTSEPMHAIPTAAVATVTTTPIAPTLPVAMVTPPLVGVHNNEGTVQLRNVRRESTPSSSGENIDYYEPNLNPSVNRSLSTRSCNETHTCNARIGVSIHGSGLRHTQSARQPQVIRANSFKGLNKENPDCLNLVTGGLTNRDSASIVCSNNSNNTRTLLMQSPLVDPTAIQISINPALTAEPVLTPREQLRRLDISIRDILLQKQKIICDIFRLPVQHFHEIVDIAMMPEAPKDSADIALAAYDQIQTLTKILNEYMHVKPEQEISAISTTFCDYCNDKNREKLQTSHSSHQDFSYPNKKRERSRKVAGIFQASDNVTIHEDDDGYCEIDELRLPTVPSKLSIAGNPEQKTATMGNPLESGEETTVVKVTKDSIQIHSIENLHEEKYPQIVEQEHPAASHMIAQHQEVVNNNATKTVSATPTQSMISEIATAKNKKSNETLLSECTSAVDPEVEKRCTRSISPFNTTSEEINQEEITSAHSPMVSINNTYVRNNPSELLTTMSRTCGPNRIQHANSLEPSVPCNALCSVISLLNQQISLLLPKINDRDMERDRLRKENQHLRELLSAMHDRQQNENEAKTPTSVTTILHSADLEFDDESDNISNTSLTPTPPTIVEDNKMVNTLRTRIYDS